VNVDLTASDVGRQIVRAYLSRQHLESKGSACLMVALPSDVARSGSSAKRTFENVFKAMVSTLEGGLNGERIPRTTAQAIAALCVGGMVVARAMNDRRFANGLCNASMAVALRLGGWTDRAKLKPEKAQRQRRGTRINGVSIAFTKRREPRGDAKARGKRQLRASGASA
jgi:TetR/AcrR family transcriptional repressor of nem operon